MPYTDIPIDPFYSSMYQWRKGGIWEANHRPLYRLLLKNLLSMNMVRYSLSESLALLADDSINDKNVEEYETTETQESISFEDNWDKHTAMNKQYWK